MLKTEMWGFFFVLQRLFLFPFGKYRSARVLSAGRTQPHSSSAGSWGHVLGSATSHAISDRRGVDHQFARVFFSPHPLPPCAGSDRGLKGMGLIALGRWRGNGKGREEKEQPGIGINSSQPCCTFTSHSTWARELYRLLLGLAEQEAAPTSLGASC